MKRFVGIFHFVRFGNFTCYGIISGVKGRKLKAELLLILKRDAQHFDTVKYQIDLYMTLNKRAKIYVRVDQQIHQIVYKKDCRYLLL